jgi:HEAT repeat protein
VQNAVEGLNSPDPIHRASAAAALGEVHGEGELVARVLLEALRDGHRRVRASAAASLGKTGQLAAANALTNLLKNPAEDCDVRASAAESLGRLQAGQAAAALMAAAQDPVWFLRYQAVVAMGRIGDPAFERALADAVRYEANAMVRSAAQESLRHLKASGRNGGINGAAEDSRRPAKEVAGTRKDD